MILLTSDGKTALNTDFVERFIIVEKSDATLIIASYNSERQPITVGKYINIREAEPVFLNLISHLSNDDRFFEMPDSVLFSGESKKMDARTERRGGS